jgi:hypothetical protein
MFVYAAISAAAGDGSWIGDDIGSRMRVFGVLWQAYWLALVVSVPGV